MKHVFTSLLLVLSLMLSAQAPQQFNYQAIARSSSGTVLANQSVSLRFSIIDQTPLGTTVYQETKTGIATNQFGLFTHAIGTGTSSGAGAFSAINWAVGAKYLKVEIDAAGGSAYVDMGTTQLNAVPYALFAASSAGGTVGPTGPTGAPGAPGNTGQTGNTGPTGPSAPSVGFNAYFSGATTVAASTGTVQRIYGSTDFNDGTGYNTTTGEFTAPVAGVYHFDVAEAVSSASGYTSGYMGISFKKNGTTIHGGVGETVPTSLAGSYATLSHSGTVKLAAGDIITVFFDNRCNVNLNITGTNSYSQFSGYLVY